MIDNHSYQRPMSLKASSSRNVQKTIMHAAQNVGDELRLSRHYGFVVPCRCAAADNRSVHGWQAAWLKTISFANRPGAVPSCAADQKFHQVSLQATSPVVLSHRKAQRCAVAVFRMAFDLFARWSQLDVVFDKWAVLRLRAVVQ